MKTLTLAFLMLIYWLPGQAQDHLVMDGKIGDDPIRLEMIQTVEHFRQKNPATYSGFYYYIENENPIFVYESKRNQSDLQLIFHGTETNEREVFDGKLINGNFSGTWKKGKIQKEFNLKSAPKTAYTELIHYKNNKLIQIPSLKTEDTIEGTYHFDWFLPKDKKIQKAITDALQLKNFKSFDTYTRQILNDFEKEFRKEVQIAKENTKVEDFYPSNWNHSFHYNLIPLKNTSNYLVMQYNGYEFTGGAHGLSFQNYFTYDKNRQKILSITDVLDTNKAHGINEILDQEVRRLYKIREGIPLTQAPDSFFIKDNIEYSENFYLSKSGITFHYGLYEMTPYAYGYFELTIPYEDFEDCLNFKFKYN